MQAGIDIEGNKNKVAGRDYIEMVVPQAPAEYLTGAQRKQLNEQVKKIAEEHGQLAGVIWKQVVHIPFGVDALAKIPLSKYAEVDRALVEYSHALTLSDMIQERAQAKLAVKKAENWAHEQFGRLELQYLKPDQLKQVLSFIDGLPSPPSGLPIDARPLHSVRGKHSTWALWWRVMGRLMLRYPGHVIALSLSGALAGKIFL